MTYLSQQPRSSRRRRRKFTSVTLDIVRHHLLIVVHNDDSITGVVQHDLRMNYSRDQGQRLGGTSQSSDYQHGPTLSTSPIEKSRFRRSETSNQQRSTSSNFQSTGTSFAPLISPFGMADRTRTPTRASTFDDTDNLHRNSNMAGQSDYSHHARSEDMNHGTSSRNINSNYGGRDPGPSPAFLNSSRPGTPGSSGLQQLQPQSHASSSGHSEHSERRLSTASLSSETVAKGKSVPSPSTSTATSVASSS